MISRLMGVSSDVLTSLREGTPILRDDITHTTDWDPSSELNVQQIRRKLRLTQEEFARRFGFDLADVCAWERGERPNPAARSLLLVIDRRPDVVDHVLKAGGPAAS